MYSGDSSLTINPRFIGVRISLFSNKFIIEMYRTST